MPIGIDDHRSKFATVPAKGERSKVAAVIDVILCGRIKIPQRIAIGLVGLVLRLDAIQRLGEVGIHLHFLTRDLQLFVVLDHVGGFVDDDAEIAEQIIGNVTGQHKNVAGLSVVLVSVSRAVDAIRPIDRYFVGPDAIGDREIVARTVRKTFLGQMIETGKVEKLHIMGRLQELLDLRADGRRDILENIFVRTHFFYCSADRVVG